MSAREVSVKKYVVRLCAEEREQLRALIRKCRRLSTTASIRRNCPMDGLLFGPH